MYLDLSRLRCVRENRELIGWVFRIALGHIGIWRLGELQEHVDECYEQAGGLEEGERGSGV